MTTDFCSRFVNGEYDTTLKNRCAPRHVMSHKNTVSLHCIVV